MKEITRRKMIGVGLGFLFAAAAGETLAQDEEPDENLVGYINLVNHLSIQRDVQILNAVNITRMQQGMDTIFLPDEDGQLREVPAGVEEEEAPMLWNQNNTNY